MTLTQKEEAKKKRNAFRNHKANKIALSPRNKHSSLSFIRTIESLMVVIEIDLLPSLKTRLLTRCKSDFFLCLFISSIPPLPLSSYYTMLTVNHHHHHTYALPQAAYNRLYGSKNQIDREKERRSKNVFIILTDIKFTHFFRSRSINILSTNPKHARDNLIQQLDANEKSAFFCFANRIFLGLFHIYVVI